MEKKDEKKKKTDTLYVAGYFSKGPNEGKKIAIKVRNTMLLNPVEPIFESYPDVECVIVGKSAAIVKKNLKKLV